MNATYAGDLMRRLARTLAAAGAVIWTGAAAHADVGNFVTIDVPGADATIVNDVSNTEIIVGRYDDAAGFHGFVLRQGALSTVDYPGAAGTSVLGVNDAGVVSGRFVLGGVDHGFILANGIFEEVDFPSSVATQCHGLNSYGQVVGRYLNITNSGQGRGSGLQHEHGYLLRDGEFTSLDYPDGRTTDGWRIAADGTIVGDWSTNATPNGSLRSGAVHGYVYSSGRFASFDFPGGLVTSARGINVNGQIVGIYADSRLVDHAFVRDGDQYTGFDFPGASWTDGSSINDRGLLVGTYGDAAGVPHGFAAMLRKN